MLQSSDATVGIDRVHALVARLLERTGDPALGLDAGRHYHLTTFGLLGAVAAVVPTAREMIQLFVEYANLTFTFFTVHFEEDGEGAQILFLDDGDLGRLRRFYLDRELAFVAQMGRSFWPETHEKLGRAVELDYPEPAEADRYRAFFPCPVRFGSDRAAFVLDLSADSPRSEANPLGLQLLKDHLRSFGGARAAEGFAGRVRREIAHAIATRRALPDSERIAEALGLSDRVLRRRLAAEGAGFRTLTDEVASQLARRYLRDTELPIADVAERVGYAETASFARAFRRWTRTTPDAYRRAQADARVLPADGSPSPTSAR